MVDEINSQLPLMEELRIHERCCQVVRGVGHTDRRGLDNHISHRCIGRASYSPAGSSEERYLLCLIGATSHHRDLSGTSAPEGSRHCPSCSSGAHDDCSRARRFKSLAVAKGIEQSKTIG